MALAILNKYTVTPLRSQGYFVSVSNHIEELNTLVVDCKMYFTDTDENGIPAHPLCIAAHEPQRTANDICIACDQIPRENIRAKPLELKRGSVICPLCFASTKPYTLKMRHFRGIFRVVPNGPAEILEPPQEKDNVLSMTNKEMIEAIADALKPILY